MYIADAEGRIRHHQFGEGGYDECERAIQTAPARGGPGRRRRRLVSVAPDGLEAQADWANLETPETYLGSEQAQNFTSTGEPEPAAS